VVLCAPEADGKYPDDDGEDEDVSIEVKMRASFEGRVRPSVGVRLRK
jgi:hypothetical protein